MELSILSLPGSAQEEDYTMNVLILSLGSAQNQSCFQVNILRDNLVEEEETFSLILTSEDPAVITSTPDSSTVYIEDINGTKTTHFMHNGVLYYVIGSQNRCCHGV